MGTKIKINAWVSGMRDSSGLRLIMTPQLRQYDAGILYMGMNVWESHVIPPYYKEFLSEGACSSDCLSQVRLVKLVFCVLYTALYKNFHDPILLQKVKMPWVKGRRSSVAAL